MFVYCDYYYLLLRSRNGQFFGLVAVYFDLPAQEDNWREPQMREICRNCSACLRHCPVSAIISERFLLRAELCITFHNEKPSDVPFLAWMDPSWHNCLMGCLHCQRVCPQNREFLHWVEERVEFSQRGDRSSYVGCGQCCSSHSVLPLGVCGESSTIRAVRAKGNVCLL